MSQSDIFWFFAKRTNEYASMKEISKEIPTSCRSIQNCIKMLVKSGFVEYKLSEGKHGAFRVYRLKKAFAE